MKRKRNKLAYVKYLLPLIFLLALTFCQQATEDVVENDNAAMTVESKLAVLMKSAVTEDEDNEQCVEFQYPIGLYVYYDGSHNIETYVINSDEELFEFFDLLTAGDQISIDFPVYLKDLDGANITIADQAQLEQTLQTAVDACRDGEFCDSDKKVSVCHNGHTICISVSALQTHLDHGDTEGECD